MYTTVPNYCCILICSTNRQCVSID